MCIQQSEQTKKHPNVVQIPSRLRISVDCYWYINKYQSEKYINISKYQWEANDWYIGKILVGFINYTRKDTCHISALICHYMLRTKTGPHYYWFFSINACKQNKNIVKWWVMCFSSLSCASLHTPTHTWSLCHQIGLRVDTSWYHIRIHIYNICKITDISVGRINFYEYQWYLYFFIDSYWYLRFTDIKTLNLEYHSLTTSERLQNK